jgi:hypothetical protein
MDFKECFVAKFIAMVMAIIVRVVSDKCDT